MSVIEIIFLATIIIITLCLLIIFVFGTVFFIYSIKFSSYLEKYNYQRWRELTTILGMGPGCANSFRYLKYIHNDQDAGDQHIKKYKEKCRTIHRIILFNFTIIFYSLITLLILLLIFKGQGIELPIKINFK